MSRKVIGCGNRLRRDDGVGPVVADGLKARGVAAEEASGEAADLLERMKGAEEVVLVDAMRSGRPAGALARFEPLSGGFEPRAFAGTHDFGPAQAVQLAQALGAAPRALVVYGIEGADFSPGEGLTPAVEAAARELVERLCTGKG